MKKTFILERIFLFQLFVLMAAELSASMNEPGLEYQNYKMIISGVTEHDVHKYINFCLKSTLRDTVCGYDRVSSLRGSDLLPSERALCEVALDVRSRELLKLPPRAEIIDSADNQWWGTVRNELTSSYDAQSSNPGWTVTWNAYLSTPDDILDDIKKKVWETSMFFVQHSAEVLFHKNILDDGRVVLFPSEHQKREKFVKNCAQSRLEFFSFGEFDEFVSDYNVQLSQWKNFTVLSYAVKKLKLSLCPETSPNLCEHFEYERADTDDPWKLIKKYTYDAINQHSEL